MVKSGVIIDGSVKDHYHQVQLRKLQGFKFIIKDSVCVVDEESVLQKDHATPFQTLVFNGLEDSQPCYIAVNICFNDTEKKMVQKLMLFVWCSDDANVRQRMLCSSSTSAIMNALGVPMGRLVELHSPDDQNVDSVFGKIIGTKAKPITFERRPVTFNEDNGTYDFADE